MAAANDVKRYPGALPGANEEQMDEIRDKLFASVTKHISEGPTFQGLQFDEQVGGNLEGWDTRPISTARTEMPEASTSAWDTRPIVSEKAEPEEEPGFLSNTARVAGQRGLQIAGSIIRGVGELGEAVDTKMGTGRIIWGGGKGLRYVSAEEFNQLKEAGVTENLFTETLPRAFQDRDLGGEKRHSPDAIKEAWKNGDASGVAKATGAFIAETGIESIPDMLAAVYSLPLYIIGRSEELAEENIRNQRLNEVLAASGGEITAENIADVQKATGYVSPEDVSFSDISRAAPFAALSSLLERVGAKGIANAGTEVTQQVAQEAAEAGMRAVLKEGGKAGAKEAATEFFQEGVLEYIAENLGTSSEGHLAALDVAEAAERGAWAALAGGGTGVTLGTGAAAINQRRKKFETDSSDPARKSKYTDVPETDIDPETGKTVIRQVEDEARSYEVPEQGFGEAERTAIENTLEQQTGEEAAQGSLDLKPEEAPPVQEALPLTPQEQPVPQEPQEVVQPPTPPNEPATTAPAEQVPTEDEVVGYDDLQTEPAPTEEVAAPVEQPAAPAEEPAAPIESPMVSAKELAEGIRNLNKKNKEALPGIRKAMQVVRRALVNRFGEENIPKLANAAGAPAIGKFFESVDESVDGVQDLLPNLKEFLQAVVASPDAAGAIQNLERLAGYINSSVQSLPTDTTQGFLSQVNEAVSLFDSFESERKSKTRKVTVKDKATGETRKEERPSSRKGFRLKDRIVQVDELATTVEQMLEHASDIGAQGVEGQDQVKGRIRQARSWRNQADRATQRVLKGGKGTVVEVLHATGAKLDETQAILRKAANDLAVSIAEREGRAAEARAQRKQPQKKVNKEQTKSEAVEKPTETKDLEASTNDIDLNKQSVNKPKKESKKNKDLEKEKKSDVIKTDTTAKQQEPWTEPVLQKDPAEWNYKDAVKAAKALGLPYVGKTKKEIIDRVNRSVDAELAAVKLKREPKKETAKQKAVETSKKRSIEEVIRKSETPEQRAALPYNDLRKLAKHLGVKAVGKKADILAAVEQWHVDNDAVVEGTVTEEGSLPHPRQSTADWVRGFVNVGGTRGVTKGTKASIEANLKILEDSNHPEAALLRKQIEKTNIKEWDGKKASMVPGAKVRLRDDLGNIRVVGIATKEGKVVDKDAGQPFVSFHKTMEEAEKEAQILRDDLKGEVVIDIRTVEEPAFLKPGETAAILAEHKASKPIPVKVKRSKLAPGVTRESMGKVSKGGMSDVFKTKQEVKTEEGIANDLNSLVEDANKVEELGGIESYEGGQEAYNLAGKITSGQVTKADLKNLSMAQLRAIAKAVAAKPAPSKDVTIDRIFLAADKEVTRVEAELAQMSQEVKAEAQAQEQAKQPKEKPQEIDVAPPDDLVEIDVKPAARGKVASKVKAALGYGDDVDLSEALANEGVDQNALNVFTSLIKSLPKEAQEQVFSALTRLVSQPDQGMGLLNFISSVEDAVGGSLSPANRMTLVEFATAMQEKSLMADAGMDARTELLHRRAEEEGRSPEDLLEIEKATQANYVFDEDTIDDVESDDFYEAFKRDTWQELDFMRVRDKFWSTLRNAIHHILRPIRTRQINELRNTLWKNIPGLAGDRSMIRKLFARDGRPTEFHRFVNEHMSIGSDLLAEPTTMNEFLDKLIASMPKNHRYYGLAKKLRSLNLDVQFTIWDSHRSVQIINNEWFGDNAITRPISGFHYVDADGFSNAKIAVGFRNYTENDGRLTTTDAVDFIHTAMHEMVHAATVQALDTNEAFRNEIYAAMRATVEHMKANNPELYSLWRRDFEKKQAGKESYELTESSREFYGMTNMREFVAEALTNPAFQKYLSTVPMPRDALGIREQVIGQVLNERGKAPNVFQYIINSMKQMLGYSIRNTVLESVIFSNMVHMSDVETQALTAFEREYESAAYGELREGLKPSRSQRKVSAAPAELQKPVPLKRLKKYMDRLEARLEAAKKYRETIPLSNVGLREDIQRAIGRSTRDLREIKDFFSEASYAETKGKYHVVDDHTARSMDRIVASSKRLDAVLGPEMHIRVKEFDNATLKYRDVEFYSFVTPEEATAKWNELVAQGKDLAAKGFNPQTGKRLGRGPVDKKGSPKVSGSAPSAQAANDIVDSQAALKKSVGYKVKEIANILKNFGVKENLAWSNRDVIERKFRDLFGKASEAMGFDGNVLTQMTKALNDASALARKFENKGYAMIKRIRNLSKEVRLEFGVQMRDITSANIDPEFPLDSVQNQHIWRTYERQDQTGPLDPKTGKPVKRPYKRDIPKDVKEKAVEARANYLRFKAENPIAARLLRDMAKLSKDIHNAKVAAAMYALGESFGFDNVTVNKMQAAKTAEDIDAIFPKDEVEKAQAKLEAMQMENVLVKPTKEEVKAAKKIISQAEARSMAASSAKKILHESSIKGWYFPLRRYGNYVVSTPPDTPKKDQFVSFHMTELDAKREAAALRKAGYDVSVSTKIEGRAIPRDVKTVAGEILKRLPRSPDGEKGIQEGVRARLTSAVNEVLAQSAAYQSQLKRANVAGVSPMDMARGYEEYVHISKYTIGDLLVSHKVADALKKIYMIQRSPDEAGLTDEEGVVAGHVANELALQDKTSATDRERSKAQEVVGALGFLNFLGAPSYWALNATQTYTITIPYLSAKYGSFKGPRQLIKSQKTVLAAVTRAVGKKKFSYEGFKDELPPDARRIVEQLEAENVIQTTIAHEFGQMLSPTFWNQMRDTAVGSGVAKGASYALQVMEKVPEAVEHYNRISTALATYALSGSMEATIDAVNETQFNYDTANRARRLKYLPGKTGAGRAFVTPIMMFKSYGVGLMRLYYGSAIKALRGQDRAEALRMVGYLTASHVAFGGVAGGIMSAPVMAIIGAANAVFREAGDEWDLEEAAEEVTREIAGDWAAIAVRRGLPAALGVDLSKSINLGNLVWMSDERFDPTRPDAWAAKVGELATGPIGAYGYRFAAEGAKVWKGSPDASLWEFAEALVPVKFVRGVSSAFRYRAEGLRTSSDLELIKPEEFSGFLATMLGFQSTQKTSIQERFWDDKAREQRRTKEKSRLIDVATRALDRGNFEAFDDTLRDIAQFNLSVEKPSEGVTPGDMARLRLRRMKAQREFDMEYAEYKEQTR